MPLNKLEIPIEDEQESAQKKTVVISVAGGFAYVKECPKDVRVLIVDWDSLGNGGDAPEVGKHDSHDASGMDEELQQAIEAQGFSLQ